MVVLRRNVCTVLLLVATCAPAVAQDALATDAEYRSVIDQAIAEFAARRFFASRTSFERAHQLAPSARTLRGIGLASYEMGDYVEAYRALRAALAETSNPLTDEQRAAASALAARARPFIGIYHLVVSPPEMRIEVDGSVAELGPDRALYLSAGEHVIDARAPGHQDRRTVVTSIGGEDAELHLSLEREPELTVDAPRAVPAAVGAPIRRPAEPDRALPIVLFAGGGALAAGSLATGLGWWLHQDREWSTCEAGGAGCINRAEVERSRTAAIATTAGLSIAAAIALGLAVLFLAIDTPRAERARVECRGGGGCAVVF
jgi:hypothetical protein